MDQRRTALSGDIFLGEPSESQQRALQRLETMLALVEGWVEEVTAQAVAAHLPHAVALREMIRRRRAAGGPAEDTFRTLVGLELRPRRAREAAALWAELTRNEGAETRDGLWSQLDLMPTGEDRDDPAALAHRRAAEDSEARRARAPAALGPDLPRHGGAETRAGLWSQLDLLPTGEDLDDPAAFAHRRAAEDSEEFGDPDAELAKILGTGDAPQDDAGEQTGDGEERPNGEPDEGLGGDQD